jgi:hypothetical protein
MHILKRVTYAKLYTLYQGELCQSASFHIRSQKRIIRVEGWEKVRT